MTKTAAPTAFGMTVHVLLLPHLQCALHLAMLQILQQEVLLLIHLWLAS